MAKKSSDGKSIVTGKKSSLSKKAKEKLKEKKKATHKKEKTLEQFEKALDAGDRAANRVEDKIIEKLRKKNGQIAAKYSADKKEREKAEGRDRFVWHSTKPVHDQAVAQAYNLSKAQYKKRTEPKKKKNK